MNVNVNIQFTEQAVATLPPAVNMHFSYDIGLPFPQTGEFVELRIEDAPRTFQVVERVFAYDEDSLTVRVLLDLVPKSEPQESGLQVWSKLGQ
ncbi:hypothetical protein [Burkholderia pyrrocinia]|uniref:hypothetical protein n=1 Tax=Burkholderia pyrrocinia TaxID=60550 RepID=UPI001BCF3CFF|nr:hypothetical protein [Burkholderia pyrrocinia]QVN18944.1 hypothetical protein JYG32_04185 [Burkholderia pyrrocinia]